MKTIRTNILRAEISSSYLQYDTDINCKTPIELHHHVEIATFIQTTFSNTALFSNPYLYSTVPLVQLVYSIFLSNGSQVVIQFSPLPGQHDSRQIIDIIGLRLMIKTELLYSPDLKSCFNPYEQRSHQDQRDIPGYSIKAKTVGQNVAFNLIPFALKFNMKEQIGESSDVLVDYYTGNFYLRQNIVRIDKQKGEVHFRDNKIIQRSGLHPIKVKPINGYFLAHEIYNFYERIKEFSGEFCQNWRIKFDTRFSQMPYRFIQPGHLQFRNNQEKSLSEIIIPMNGHNWNNNFIGFFQGVCFDDNLICQLVFFSEQNEKEFMMQLAKHIDNIKFRMGINVSTKLIIHSSIETIDELIYLIRNENTPHNPHKIYLFTHNIHKTKLEKDNFEKVIQYLIDKNLLFHLLEVDHTQKDYDFQVASYKHLSTIYSKFRLNPWKIKNIPFSNVPMVTMTLHIQKTREKLYSVALVSTMNFYLTKFTACHKISTPQNLIQTISLSIKQCIDKFKFEHNRFPNRIFVFRSGQGESEDLTQEHNAIKYNISNMTGSIITYITLTKDHPLRTFYQLDNNYIERQTVKKIQLLLYIEIKQELYCQLELQEPMHLLKIYQVEKIDPNFVAKVLQLAAKVIFGSVGHSYGCGLGFIDFSKKLNVYRQFNLTGWQDMLREGIFPFL